MASHSFLANFRVGKSLSSISSIRVEFFIHTGTSGLPRASATVFAVSTSNPELPCCDEYGRLLARKQTRKPVDSAVRALLKDQSTKLKQVIPCKMDVTGEGKRSKDKVAIRKKYR